MFNIGKNQEKKPLKEIAQVTRPLLVDPTLPSYEVEQVFVPRGIPDITLIDRSAHPKLDQARKHLKSGGLVSLYGDSKSGKTVLCLKVLEKHNPILLHGPHIQTEAEFWRIVGNKLSVPSLGIASHGSSEQQAREREAQVVGGGGPFPGSITRRVAETFAHREDKGIVSTFNYGPHEVVEQLRDSRRPVVIDDFHAVPKDVQQGIIMRMKPAIDFGVTLVVVSIPEEIGDIVSGLTRPGEAVARSAKVESPLWEPDEIKQIAEKGFAALNMRVSKIAIDTLTRRAYRNPLLMQDFCLNLCFGLGVERTLSEPTDFDISAADIDRVVAGIAAQYEPGYRAYLGSAEGSAKKWRLATGHEVNLYVLILLSLSGIAINSPVRVIRIRERMENILDRNVNPPNEGNITQALSKMTERMNLDDQEAPLRFDATRHLAYIAHPFFKLFLVWNLAKKYS